MCVLSDILSFIRVNVRPMLISLLLPLAAPVHAQPEFSSDSLYRFSYQLQNSNVLAGDIDTSARLRVRIYAYDSVLADISAVVLKTDYILKPEVGTEYRVEFTGKELKRALQRYHGSERIFDDHEAGVYLIWALDLNGDGQFCKGDLRLDYEQTGDQFYAIVPGSTGMTASIKVYLKPEQGTRCLPFE